MRFVHFFSLFLSFKRQSGKLKGPYVGCQDWKFMRWLINTLKKNPIQNDLKFLWILCSK